MTGSSREVLFSYAVLYGAARRQDVSAVLAVSGCVLLVGTIPSIFLIVVRHQPVCDDVAFNKPCLEWLTGWCSGMVSI